MSQPPKCKCGIPAAARTVRKEGPNKGRTFYGCSKYPNSEECKFFAWAPPGTVAAGSPGPSQPSPHSHPGGSQHSWQQQHQQQQQWGHGQPPGGGAYGPPSPGMPQYGGSQPSPGRPPSQQQHWQQQQQQHGGYGQPPANGTGGGMYGPPSPGMPHYGGSHQSPVRPPSQQQRAIPASFHSPQQPARASGYQGSGSAYGGAGASGSQFGGAAGGSAYGGGRGGGGGGGGGGGDVVRVELQVVDADTFGAAFRFNMDLKEYIKALPPPYKPRWDQGRRLWSFPLAHYQDVLQLLERAPFPVTVVPIPKAALDRFKQAQEGEAVPPEEVESRLARIPPDVWGKLYSFQKEGVRFVVEHGGRALIADEMGLGKTVQALCSATCFAPEDWPLLIVCPSTMKLVWRDALYDWLPQELHPQPHNLLVVKDGKSLAKLQAMDSDTNVRVVIVSFDMVKKLEGDELAQFHTAIVDESHHLKSTTTQRTRCLDAVVKKARRVILMTGTPALSRPIELYPQINMLRPGLFGSFDDFGMRYCDGKPAINRFQASPSGMDYRGSSCEGELHAMLCRHVMIRRLKGEVLDELPEKVRMKITIEVDPDHAGNLAAVRAEMRAVEADSSLSEEEVGMRRRQLLTELYRKTGAAKCKAAAEHIMGLLESGEKVLVFAHHKEVLDQLQGDVMEAGDRKYVRIDGQVVNERRKAAVDRFQSDTECRAALLSITAAGVGITLTAATVVVFVELYWNPGHLIQAEDRAHRVGQRQSVKVHYLLAEGSADNVIWPLCNQKLRVVGRSVAGATGLETGDTYRTTGELLLQQAAREAGDLAGPEEFPLSQRGDSCEAVRSSQLGPSQPWASSQPGPSQQQQQQQQPGGPVTQPAGDDDWGLPDDEVLVSSLLAYEEQQRQQQEQEQQQQQEQQGGVAAAALAALGERRRREEDEDQQQGRFKRQRRQDPPQQEELIDLTADDD